ncbi:MAG: UvrD-helicase domain-containing protein [Verrucomicrobiales bacterium]
MDILSKNLLILASAGSGKTYQLSNRVIGLLAGGARPESIVALTFTRKAAGEFADEILKKVAAAAGDEARGRDLAEAIGLAEVPDFRAMLGELVRALPRMNLGTMDSFFAKLIIAFQYELGLTGGSFELVQGARLEEIRNEMIGRQLSERLRAGADLTPFMHSFRRANHGKESVRVLATLADFVDDWYEATRAQEGPVHWGLPGAEDKLAGAVEEWETRRDFLVSDLERSLEGTEYGEGGKLQKNFKPVLEQLANHRTGSGVFKGNKPVLAERLVEQVAAGMGEVEMELRGKPYSMGEKASELVTEILNLMARAELAAAVERTKGLGEVITDFDRHCEREMRRKGLLSFGDVKEVMSAWQHSEEGRLAREQMDYRLNARYDHWLLDEFQDTSRLDWNGLQPLVSEAMTGEGQSVFVVGDRKQGIYGWRGGEVGLLDELFEKYGMRRASMPVSYRSCTEVLDLVNQVCGDEATMSELFGAERARQWQWERHRAARAELRGYASVRRVQKNEELAEMVRVMREVGIGQKQLSCGVLVRRNVEAAAAAEYLRAEGFQVVEEGVRKPAHEHPLGQALRYLVRWLAWPGSTFERELLWMSPLGGILRARFGDAWQAVWEGVLAAVGENSYADFFRELTADLSADLSVFGRERLRELLVAVADFERGRVVTARQLAEFLEGLEIVQEPGAAAVQVMTIHKSKGLGFDVVFLPQISDAKVPDDGKFRQMRGAGWQCQAPVKWARSFFPALVEVEETWAAAQVYEAFCVLYVALTRAKRGLYVFLEAKDEKKKKKEKDKASLHSWVLRSCGGELTDEEIFFESGRADWAATLPDRSVPERESALPRLGEAVWQAKRRIASGGEEAAVSGSGDGGGALFGNAVHEEFEKLGTLADVDRLADNAAGDLVRACLEVPEIRALFEPAAGVELRREQAFEARLDGVWLSGVIDRLELRRDATGKVSALRIIDFKTDRVADAGELRQRHAAQMRAYREAMEKAWPGSEVEVVLLSTSLRCLVPVVNEAD